MQLAPPTEGYYEHTLLDLLIKQIIECVKNEGYAVTPKRSSKSSKPGILMKAVLHCDRGGKWLDEGHGHHLTKSKRNECPFECMAKLDGNEEYPESDLSNWIYGCSIHRFWACERYVSDLQLALGIDEKNLIFAPKNVCFPPYFPASMVFTGKWKSPKLGVQGWCASKVRWCVGSGCPKFWISWTTSKSTRVPSTSVLQKYTPRFRETYRKHSSRGGHLLRVSSIGLQSTFPKI